MNPIYKKKGSKLYRPVSLTSTVCKILESIIRDKIIKYLKLNNLIIPEQNGFVPNKAFITNLLKTLEIITGAISEGFSVDLMILGFVKASIKSHIANLC